MLPGPESMKILLASSEAVPFAKTGGLADVAAGLSKALGRLGHEVTLALPLYPQQIPGSIKCTRTGLRVSVTLGDRKSTAEIVRARMPGSSVEVLLMDRPAYFDRPALYTSAGADYTDNCERFVFLSRAVLEAARILDLRPDVIHANDWQTGLIPALVSEKLRGEPGFERTAAVFTIHNMAFQGRFWHWDMALTGLGWEYFNWRQMEFWGGLNLLKTGIVFADLVTTVSPTYAREICTSEFGYGLENVLSERSRDLIGILNGVDTDEWDPARDTYLPRPYSIDSWNTGKPVCKQALQQELGLPQRADVPIVATVSRLTDQKGFDLIRERIETLLSGDLQFVVLGSGESAHEEFIRSLSQRYPQQVAARIGFDEALAHRIEAASDLFLMPSRFEPCGLNQQYSMRYGSVPVVHGVGGLADSVIDASPANLQRGSATGFVFHEYHPDAFQQALQRSLDAFRDRATWNSIVHAGMSRDCSWSKSATEYVKVYEEAIRHCAGAE
jgi:starch synthase